jgi:hypothetical protein
MRNAGARFRCSGVDAGATVADSADMPNQRIAAHRTNIRDMMHLPATTTLLRR